MKSSLFGFLHTLGWKEMNWLINKQKGATRKRAVDMAVNYSKAEIKSIIKSGLKKRWQEEWDRGNKGKYFHSIQKKLGEMRTTTRDTKEEDISTMRFGLTGLNSTLKIMNKHNTGRGDNCNQQETVEHIFLVCPQHHRQRQTFKNSLQRNSLTLRLR